MKKRNISHEVHGGHNCEATNIIAYAFADQGIASHRHGCPAWLGRSYVLRVKPALKIFDSKQLVDILVC